MTRPDQDYRLLDSLRDYIDAYTAYRVAAGYVEGSEGAPLAPDMGEAKRQRARATQAEELLLERLEDFVVRRAPHHSHPHNHVMGTLPLAGTREIGKEIRTSREG